MWFIIALTNKRAQASVTTPCGQPLLTSGNKGANSALEGTALQEYPALALEAFNADVGSYPDHLPLIAAAGVLLLEADDIAQL